MPRLKEIVNEKIKAEEHHVEKGGMIRKIDSGGHLGIVRIWMTIYENDCALPVRPLVLIGVVDYVYES